MRKIFWENPYQTKLSTMVSKVDGDEVLFAETIAYSFSGGQESDSATVNGLPILSSRIHGSDIYYTISENHGLSVNDKVEMEIDWSCRNKLMRLHFACELILVIINRIFASKQIEDELAPEDIDNVGIVKTGAHISEDKARIDFKLDENISNLFPSVLSEYNRIINANVPIITGFIDEVSQHRYWRIEGVALVPCGGTHVRTTAEVGFIELKRECRGKGIERIKITLKDPILSEPEISNKIL